MYRPVPPPLTAGNKPLIEAVLTIGGEFVGRSGDLEMAPVVDPATQDVVGWAPVADEATVDAAVSAAAKAFGSWGALPATTRSEHLASDCQLDPGSRAGTLEDADARTRQAAQ